MSRAHTLTAKAAQHLSPYNTMSYSGGSLCPQCAMPLAFNKHGCTCCIHALAQSLPDIFQRKSSGELQLTSGVNHLIFCSLLAVLQSSPVPHLQQTIPQGDGALQCMLPIKTLRKNMQLNSTIKYCCRKRRTIQVD